MARTFKDQIMLDTVHELVTITGITDDEIIKWTVAELRDRMKEAQGDAGPYWQIFLRALRKRLEQAYSDALTQMNFTVTEINVMEWPEALANPNSSAAASELDDVADQIRVEIR